MTPEEPVCSMLELLVGGGPKFPSVGVGLGRELSFSSVFPEALQKALNRPRLENEWGFLCHHNAASDISFEHDGSCHQAHPPPTVITGEHHENSPGVPDLLLAASGDHAHFTSAA